MAELAGDLMPPGLKLDIVNWRDVPVFDGDVLAQGLPPAVAALRERVRRADGVLIATPEYIFSVPGGLNNLPPDVHARARPAPGLTAGTQRTGAAPCGRWQPENPCRPR